MGPEGPPCRHPLSDPLRPILFCSLDPSKHEKWTPPSPNWDELPVWRHFQNGRHGNWQNHVFAYNSASRVDRNDISVSTPICLRVRNSIKALTNFYGFYLTHDELPVWRHFQNGRYGNWQNHVFAYNLASRADRNEISVSTPILLRVRNSVKTVTSFYYFYLTHSSKLLPLNYMEITTFTIFHQARYVGDCLHTSNIHCNFLYISYYNIVIICCHIQNKCQYCLI